MLSAGDTPAVLFYLLDRHALLAMTMGSKCGFLNSLTTPGCAHPSNGGELGTYRRGEKFPSAEGCRRSRRGGYFSLGLFVIVGGGARVGVFINVRYFRHVYPGVQLGGGQRRMSQQFL